MMGDMVCLLCRLQVTALGGGLFRVDVTAQQLRWAGMLAGASMAPVSPVIALDLVAAMAVSELRKCRCHVY